MGKHKPKTKPGDKYGRLTVLELLKDGMVRCKCECGQTTVKLLQNVRQGGTTSCGCKNRADTDEKRAQRAAAAMSLDPEARKLRAQRASAVRWAKATAAARAAGKLVDED